MIKNVVLVLMQIKGISRKTIYRSFEIDKREYSINDIPVLFQKTAIKDVKIRIPSVREVEEAVDRARSIEKKSEDLGIKIVTCIDENFPDKLRKISDPPAVLYYKGDLAIINRWAVGVIGTREPTEYGIKVAENLGYVLGRDGYTIVGGLAYGCDKSGHIGCLKANGKTVAVMAGGLDKIYPAKHKDIAEQIVVSGGCLLSEYPVGTRTFQNFFIERDRLQSAVSDGIIVIETDIKGGTMHTVDFAVKDKKVIGALKHPNKYFKERKIQGNQKLISEGIAYGIQGNYELYKFKEMVKARYYELGIESNAESNQPRQASMFDYI